MQHSSYHDDDSLTDLVEAKADAFSRALYGPEL